MRFIEIEKRRSGRHGLDQIMRGVDIWDMDIWRGVVELSERGCCGLVATRGSNN